MPIRWTHVLSAVLVAAGGAAAGETNAVIAAGNPGCLAVSASCPTLDVRLDAPELSAVDLAAGYGDVIYTNSHNFQILRLSPYRLTADPSTFRYDLGAITLAMDDVYPFGLSMDDAGVIFTFDGFRGIMWRLAPGRVRERYAGGGTGCGNGSPIGDGCLATDAVLGFVFMSAVAPNGDLYLGDQALGRVRKIDAATHVITTVAGGGGDLDDGGPATGAAIFSLAGLAIRGDIYIADGGSARLRRVDLQTGTISTVAGTGTPCPPNTGAACGDGGPAAQAQMGFMGGLSFDQELGTLYVTDRSLHSVRKIEPVFPGAGIVGDPGEIVTTIAGTRWSGYSDDGPALARTLSFPFAATYFERRLFVGDTHNQILRELALDAGTLTRISGIGVPEHAPATEFSLLNPEAMVCAASGDCFITELLSQLIYRISTDGTISTFAGVRGNAVGVPLNDGGLATQASIGRPQALAIDPESGELYFTSTNNLIRRIDTSTGIIRAVAGNGGYGVPEDGADATTQPLGTMYGIAVEDGVVHASSIVFGPDNILDNRVLVVGTDGIVRTFAGGDGHEGYCPDGAAPRETCLDFPSGLRLHGDSLYISDENNGLVRRALRDGSGTVTTVAGTQAGADSFCGDGGPATSACLFFPRGTAFDDDGNLYIADICNSRVRKVEAATGTISTLAGNHPFNPYCLDSLFAGDGGRARDTALGETVGLAFDPAGSLYVTDPYTNGMVWRLNRATPVLTATPSTVSLASGSGTFTVVVGGPNDLARQAITAQAINAATLRRSAPIAATSVTNQRAGVAIGFDLAQLRAAVVTARIRPPAQARIRVSGAQHKVWTGDVLVQIQP
jgi:hypothetical protein